MNPTLSAVVSAVKVIARDTLRMKIIMPVQTAISELKAQITDYEKSVKTAEHTIEVAQFKLSKIDAEDPDKEVITTRRNKEIETATEDIACLTKSIESTKKAITEKEVHILEIEAGKVKVDRESLDCLTESFLEARQEAAAVTVVPTTQAVN